MEKRADADLHIQANVCKGQRSLRVGHRWKYWMIKVGHLVTLWLTVLWKPGTPSSQIRTTWLPNTACRYCRGLPYIKDPEYLAGPLTDIIFSPILSIISNTDPIHSTKVSDTIWLGVDFVANTYRIVAITSTMLYGLTVVVALAVQEIRLNTNWQRM